MSVGRTIPILAAILLAIPMPASGLAGPGKSAPEPAAVESQAPADSPPGNQDDALESLRKAKAGAGIESRRNRSASFEVRFGGQFILGNKFEIYQQPGYDYDEVAYVHDLGNAGQVQIGVGGGWLFDFRASLTIPTWTVVAEFEFNLVKKGRWVPTVGAGVGFGVNAGVLLKVDVGIEFWILDWLAAYATIGIGMEIRPLYADCVSCEHDGIGGVIIVAPVTFGLEMRY